MNSTHTSIAHRLVLWLCGCSLTLALMPAAVNAQRYPEPDPPTLPARPQPAPRVTPELLAAPPTEWTNHRNANGTRPSAAEQRMMWLMNRARANPTAEGVWLAESTDPDIRNGRDFFGVDLQQLKSAFAALAVKAPGAFDIRLHNASVLHSQDLIARDAQDHTGQIEKVQASGFSCNGGRFSVFAYADSALNAHAALNIDWGYGPGGMQDPPGHRYAIMDVATSSLSNVGFALVPENNSQTDVGPLVFSGAYCHAGGADQNRFIVGTVWDDLNQDGEYDEGEGLGGVTVMPDAGTYYAVTGDAGGYAIPITAAGTYTVGFSGGDLGAVYVSKQVNVGAESVLLDAKPGDVSSRPVLMRRSTDSRWFVYLLSGADITDKGFVNLTRNADYGVVSRADFNGDGEADVLLRDLTGNQNGRWVLSTLSSRTVTSQGFVELTRSAAWQVVATADFNADDRADVLLRNSQDGRWLIYLLNSQAITAQGILAMSTSLTDSVAGTGDFNADGRGDVLLRRADGSWLLYLLNGVNAPAQAAPAMTTNLQFTVQAVADFSGDGRSDVLLRRPDGRWFLYTLNAGAILTSGAPPMSENPDYGLESAADFNGDDRADVLLRRSDGNWFMYALNGLAILDQGNVAMTANTAFQTISNEDFNGDGKADALLRRSDGRWVLYTLNGPDVAAQGVPDMSRNAAWVPYVPAPGF